jgi:hypothetical protein
MVYGDAEKVLRPTAKVRVKPETSNIEHPTLNIQGNLETEGRFEDENEDEDETVQGGHSTLNLQPSTNGYTGSSFCDNTRKPCFWRTS